MKLYRECPECLHGTKRDVETVEGQYLGDIECGRCNGTGFVEIDKVFRDTVISLYEIDNLGFVDAIRDIFTRSELFG